MQLELDGDVNCSLVAVGGVSLVVVADQGTHVSREKWLTVRTFLCSTQKPLLLASKEEETHESRAYTKVRNY